MTDPVLAGIKGVPYFAEVPDSDLEKLLAAAVKKSYPRNSVIINEGDEAGAGFVILSGRVHAFLSNESGRTVTLSTLEAGAFFGELSLLDGEPRSASVMTLEPTTCVLIPRRVFQVWLHDHPDAALNIIRNLTGRIRILTENVRSLALSGVYGRLAKSLTDAAVADGETWIVAPKPSHQDLANILGCSREMVSRIMKDLARGGYLATEGRQLRLLRKLPSSW